MSGFTRRFNYYPGTEVLTQIEGVSIVDLPPPGSISGVATGVVAAVGECADMTYATSVDTSGNVSTKIVPQEVLSAQDLINKFGGFDETLGEFGVSGGNLYAALRSKSFSRLILAAVNLCSAKGARVFRQLPVCRSQTDAAAVVPVLGGTVSAGREFRSGAGRLKIGARQEFTANEPITSGTAGSCTSGASAVTQEFESGALDWTTITRPDGTLGAAKGDIFVLGYNNGGAIAPVAEGGTYRVASTPASGTTLTIERLDGAAFEFTSQANVPWRLHLASDADTALVIVPGAAVPGGYAAADAGGYTVPIRPITDSAGAQSDGTYSAGTVLAPAVVPDAADGDSWDPLSGLGARTIVGGTTAFTAATQGINPVASATIDALYATAIDAFLADEDPVRDANLIVAARTSANNRTKLRSHVLEASQRGRGRIAVISPDLAQQTTTAVTATASPGVGATRAERVVYAWPGERVYVQEAVGFRLKVATGLTTIDGILDLAADFRAASVMSNLAPERNPGQAAEPVPTVMATVVGIQRGVSGLGINEYVALRAAGIMAMRIDRRSGPIFQSGVTSSLTSGQKNIFRRRMADFIQDSLSERLVGFSKLPLTNQLKDGAVGEVDAFLLELQSPNNPAAQRINQYQVDDKSGNTPNLEAKGIYVIITRVRLTPTADFIVLQTEIGENVVITEQAA